jgi:tripartite-type tricarboxylate transporter receptor subunit TctC
MEIDKKRMETTVTDNRNPKTGMTKRLMLAATLAGLMFTAGGASAEDAYPTRSIRLVVPYPPGAITDTLSRVIAAELGKELGQSVVVENRPGGGTVIGTQAVRNAPADGYSILFQLGALVTNVYSLKQAGYVLSDFAPVGMIGQSAYVLIVSTSQPFPTLKDLVDYGKKNPGKLNYSSTGSGGSLTVLGSMMKESMGIDWTEINYKGGAEATQAVMSGDVQLSLPTQGAPLIHANPDKLRILAITGDKRVALLPDVPTFKELGYPSLVSETWFGLFLRSNTPKPIVDKVKVASEKVIKSQIVQDFIKAQKVSPYEGKLEDVPAKLDRELAEFSEQAKKAGVLPQ